MGVNSTTAYRELPYSCSVEGHSKLTSRMVTLRSVAAGNTNRLHSFVSSRQQEWSRWEFGWSWTFYHEFKCFCLPYSAEFKFWAYHVLSKIQKLWRLRDNCKFWFISGSPVGLWDWAASRHKVWPLIITPITERQNGRTFMRATPRLGLTRVLYAVLVAWLRRYRITIQNVESSKCNR